VCDNGCRLLVCGQLTLIGEGLAMEREGPFEISQIHKETSNCKNNEAQSHHLWILWAGSHCEWG
jgi:hypothetical protein